jgi:hypothetical protein
MYGWSFFDDPDSASDCPAQPSRTLCVVLSEIRDSFVTRAPASPPPVAQRRGVGPSSTTGPPTPVRPIKSTCVGAIHVRAQIPPALTGVAR